jgi:hypothetical protein
VEVIRPYAFAPDQQKICGVISPLILSVGAGTIGGGSLKQLPLAGIFSGFSSFFTEKVAVSGANKTLPTAMDSGYVDGQA